MTPLEILLLIIIINFVILNITLITWFLYNYLYFQKQDEWKHDIERWAQDVQYPDNPGTFSGIPTEPERYRVITSEEADMSNPDNEWLYHGWDQPDEVIAPWTTTNNHPRIYTILNPDEHSPSVMSYHSLPSTRPRSPLPSPPLRRGTRSLSASSIC